MQRTYSLDINEKIGQKVLLKGWIHARRDMGRIIFLDLRDKKGLIQVVLTPQDLPEQEYNSVKEVRVEWVVEIMGVVQKRGVKQVNPDLPTGAVEVLAKQFKVINKAKILPFNIDRDTFGINEELRLKYRYLDLRTERLRRNIKLRHQVIHFVRNYLTELDFTEIQTPILTKSTPEGARDYLVPSRRYPGKFFALPQSPQQYKQLLMVAGIEKYFQIAPCFRDEDARADRSPGEFYQIDIEMSFISQEEILTLVEEMLTKLVKFLLPQKKITHLPWPRLDYDEVMKKYGTDKPDLRRNKEDPEELAFAWIVNFPLFVEQSKDDLFWGAGERLAPSHHMFTAPKEEDIPLLTTDPLKVRSYQHDLILNGVEIGGGSLRIHEPELQKKIFELIGFDEQKKQEFRHLLKAFEYGVPPHGGIAPGVDRLVSLLAGERNIREVIAFPLLSEARDPLMSAPSEVSEDQLKELHLKITRENKI